MRLGLPDSRFTYAVGQLVLWVPGESEPGPHSLLSSHHRLAIANPATAPYGVAARQLLRSLSVWESGTHKLILGNSVGQAFQFIVSGNVTAALVAYSQLLQYKGLANLTSEIWIVPQTDYQPIEQQAIILNRGSVVAGEFLEFLKSPAGRGIIKENGYLLSR